MKPFRHFSFLQCGSMKVCVGKVDLKICLMFKKEIEHIGSHKLMLSFNIFLYLRDIANDFITNQKYRSRT